MSLTVQVHAMNKEGKLPGIGKEMMEFRQYQPGSMQKDVIIRRLKENGFRITRQRKLLIDIILEEKCTCCKEIYILASKKDPGIGTATVYRTVDALEQIGALKRKTTLQLFGQERTACRKCLVELEDNSTVELDCEAMEKVIEKGLKHCGYSDGKRVKGLRMMNCLKED